MTKKTKKISTPKAVEATSETQATEKKVPFEVVSYVPNGVDYGVRPKNTTMPAIVVNRYEQEIPTSEGSKTRMVVNLFVLQDSDQMATRKVRVPHKDDAVGGESYYEDFSL